jgi:hypothetical protein
MSSLSGTQGTQGAQSSSREANKSFDFGDALTQMLLMKIIEMQMNSSSDDKKGFF